MSVGANRAALRVRSLPSAGAADPAADALVFAGVADGAGDRLHAASAVMRAMDMIRDVIFKPVRFGLS
jgi:hypothetical protein